ncbi:hypothetical protein K493DRAFT_13866 [Basidiobolus meristosporus CBS 931.73]|uniref:Uncharacterized protein n=1 Tax=Basidiobolus meristosporus CBS 931.73 TaxID=1314790 RepID=A0A1Y1YHX6_9FUNG|nr:hypothetical protein K493DRAFT_13866 [Basidiobolus meristosporus CBS 931.73]|eukprot:ORX97538.1 hypothetical protein K493DRAFT_13866 [Basidiobolus meristosporus CBS 931.73]
MGGDFLMEHYFSRPLLSYGPQLKPPWEANLCLGPGRKDCLLLLFYDVNLICWRCLHKSKWLFAPTVLLSLLYLWAVRHLRISMYFP